MITDLLELLSLKCHTNLIMFKKFPGQAVRQGGFRKFSCKNSRGELTERTTVSRAFGADTCDVTTETGSSHQIARFQDCNFQPQCYIEAQRLGTAGRIQTPRRPKLIPTSVRQTGKF